MSFTLARHPRFPGRPGPLVLVVMDGVGVGRGDEADAVTLARTPALDRLRRGPVSTTLRAHGTAVGLPSDGDMGNSEVGHNALGAGRVYDQGAKLVGHAIAGGQIFATDLWRDLVGRRALHFIGLLSDGNVHSHIDHLEALLRAAAAAGQKRLFLHALLDGRDVPATSALLYVERIERVLAEVGGKLASGGGRMVITMDRYEADWAMVERGWRTHVLGEGRGFASARQAIETYRSEHPGVGDQFLPPFVIPAADGTIQDGDGVVFFNFRGDRAIEISRAFDQDDFAPFDRVRRPDVLYAGMMEYDGDFHIPRHFLVPPPDIERTMGEYLARNGVAQLAISETQKYGHCLLYTSPSPRDS